MWDPFWFDSWYSPGWDVGYGYDPDSYNYYPPYGDSPFPPYSSYSTEGPADTYQNEPASQDSSSTNVITGSVESPSPLVQLYFKNGAIVPVTDYWIADSRLHYVDSNGIEITIDMDQLDLQRTVDENTRRGMQFTLKPVPNGSNTAPDSNSPPSNSTGSTN